MGSITSEESVTKVNLLKEELVSNSLFRLGNDTGRINNGKSLVELNLNLVVISIGNGCGKNVRNLLCVNIGKVNSPEVCLGAFLDSDAINACSPSYREGNAFDNNLANKVIIVGDCCSAILVGVEEIGLSIVESRTVFCVVSAETGDLVKNVVKTGDLVKNAVKTGDLVAAYKRGEGEDENEKNC